MVTGGASGIGRALAEALATRGAEVVLADLQIDLATDVALQICQAGGSARAFKVDVTDFSALQQLVQDTVNRTGRLDYMFNNAGIGIGGSVHHFRLEDWTYILDVNLRGVINGVQAVYAIMRQQGFGHIINTASIAGLMPSPGGVAYATTKYAVVGLSTSLRAEAAPCGVFVSVICPGVIETPILEDGGKYGRMLIEVPPETMRQMWDRLRPMPPDRFARKALRAVANNKAIIVIPSWWKVFWWLHRVAPSLGMRLAQKRFQTLQAQLGIGDEN